MNSPASRSLTYLKKNGFIAQVVEKWNPYARVRQDLFGFIDIVAVKEDFKGVLGIQTTSTANIPTRVRKILSIPEAKIWLQSGNKIIVQGWSKKRTTGKRETYQLKERELLLTDFN